MARRAALTDKSNSLAPIATAKAVVAAHNNQHQQRQFVAHEARDVDNNANANTNAKRIANGVDATVPRRALRDAGNVASGSAQRSRHAGASRAHAALVAQQPQQQSFASPTVDAARQFQTVGARYSIDELLTLRDSPLVARINANLSVPLGPWSPLPRASRSVTPASSTLAGLHSASPTVESAQVVSVATTTATATATPPPQPMQQSSTQQIAPSDDQRPKNLNAEFDDAARDHGANDVANDNNANDDDDDDDENDDNAATTTVNRRESSSSSSLPRARSSPSTLTATSANATGAVDAKLLAKRLKQLAFGRQSLSYQMYAHKRARGARLPTDPRTPRPEQVRQ